MPHVQTAEGPVFFLLHENDPYRVEHVAVRQVRTRRRYVPIRYDRAMRRSISAQAHVNMTAWAAPWTVAQALLHRLQAGARTRNHKGGIYDRRSRKR